MAEEATPLPVTEPVPPPAAAPIPPPRKRRRGLIGCLGVVVVLFACVGIEFYRASQFERIKGEAEAARDRGDCTEAMALYDRAVKGKSFTVSDSDIDEIGRDRQECQVFLDVVAVEESGTPGDALVAYDGFIGNNPGSALLTPARDRSHALFASSQPEALATVNSCGSLAKLIEHELVPEPDTNLPLFYAGCGQAFFDAGEHSQAVAILQQLGAEYPGHPRVKEVEPLLASAILAEAQAMGAGTIPAPQSTGQGTGSGPTTVVIQNDSPEEMSLVFKGPETRIETLAACADCEDFSGEGPESCPEKGPIGRYELPAGTYDVVVRSISDTGVTPFTGSWELAPGDEYYSCFYLVTR